MYLVLLEYHVRWMNHLINMRYFIFFLLFGAFFGCNFKSNSQTPEKANDPVYVFEPVGWKMKIPDGYEILSREEGNRLTEKGFKSIRESVGQDFEVQPHQDLLSFRKDRFNVFISSSQVMDSLEFYPHEEVHNGVVEIMLKTYQDSGMKVEHKRGSEIIYGRSFITDEFKLYTPEGRHFLTQLMFTTLFGDIELSATASWNQDQFRDEMLKAWRSSAFKK